MTNIENESQGPEARRPVIDLEAEDISPPADTGDTGDLGETEAPKEEAVSPPPPPPERTPFWTKGRIAGAAAVIAALLGAWAYREFGAHWWPPSAMSAMEEKLGVIEASNRTLNEQLVALSGAFDNLKSGTAQTAEEQAQKTEAVETKLGDLDKALSELRQSVTNLGSGEGGSADPAALADVTRRIEQLEQQVAELRQGATTTTTPTTGNEEFARLSQALSDLKAKFQAGVAYKDELDRIAIYVPQNADLAELAPFAASGLANAQVLGGTLEALVPTLAGRSSGDPATAETSGFWAWMGTVVKIRDLNTLDWADLARSAAGDAKAGDLKAAIARLEEPGGELPPELAQWRDKARQRLEAEAAMAQLAAAVTQIIMGKP
ncbi:COG4223 family protein [Taklimakanibacter deserti]|uniref:COG4223 family protein n=1 Tax=Taklimakanibacter deserti TaxID=2267839 RepID=UPI0013C44112